MEVDRKREIMWWRRFLQVQDGVWFLLPDAFRDFGPGRKRACRFPAPPDQPYFGQGS